MTLSQCSSVTVSAGVSLRAMPALLTRMSTLPWRATRSSATSRHALGVGDVHHHDLGLETLGLQAGLARLLGDLAVAVGDDDLGAGLGQRLDAGEPNAPPAAGDQRGLAVQLEFFQIHGVFPILADLAVAVSLAEARCRSASKRWMRADPASAGPVAGVQAEFADCARRERAERPGIDIEEGVAAEMLGDRDRARPALAVAR